MDGTVNIFELIRRLDEILWELQLGEEEGMDTCPNCGWHRCICQKPPPPYPPVSYVLENCGTCGQPHPCRCGQPG